MQMNRDKALLELQLLTGNGSDDISFLVYLLLKGGKLKPVDNKEEVENDKTKLPVFEEPEVLTNTFLSDWFNNMEDI